MQVRKDKSKIGTRIPKIKKKRKKKNVVGYHNARFDLSSCFLFCRRQWLICKISNVKEVRHSKPAVGWFPCFQMISFSELIYPHCSWCWVPYGGPKGLPVLHHSTGYIFWSFGISELIRGCYVMRKPVYAICEQQRRRSACASAQSDQRLCYSLLI